MMVVAVLEHVVFRGDRGILLLLHQATLVQGLKPLAVQMHVPPTELSELVQLPRHRRHQVEGEIRVGPWFSVRSPR